MTAPQPAPVDTPCVGGRRAGDMLGVDERTILRWAEDGSLPVAYRTRGGHRRYRVGDVERLAAQDGADQ